MSSSPRIIVLPRLDDADDFDLVQQLQSALPQQSVLTPGSVGNALAENAWIAAVCLGIARTGAAFEGMHLVARGAVVDRLHLIAMAQRSGARPVHSYICIDAVPTGRHADWPDAPVVVIATAENSELENLARLRGWDFYSGSATAQLVARAVTALNP